MPNGTLQAVRKIYPVPLFWWAVRGPAYRTIRAQLEDSRLAQMGLVDAEALQDQFEKSIREEDTRADIWSPLAAEMWLRAHWT